MLASPGTNTKVLKARSALGVASRRGDTEGIEVARRDLAAEKITAYISRVVDAAPPLTPEQRDRIAALLAPIGGASE